MDDKFNNDEDFPSEFEPEKDSSASEYNPYSGFLDDDSAGSQAEVEEETSENTEIKKKEVPHEGKVTTEEDIELPDFMNKAANAGETYKEEKYAGEKFSSEEQKDDFDPKDFSESKEEESASENKENSSETASSASTSKEEKTENVSGGKTEDKAKDLKFESKISAGEADHAPKSKPKVLNKKFLLSSIIITLGLTLVITFLMPSKKKNSKKNEKPVAERHTSTDYASLASRPPEEQQNYYQDVSAAPEPKDEKDDEIPPLIPPKDEKLPYNANTVNYNTGKGGGAGGSSGIEIPDTRNDSLQGKSISGIKGLTSTQQSYSTDYQQTIAKNTTSSGNTGGYSLPSKEEYMNNVLGAYSQAYGNATSQNNAYKVQNDQDGKNSFFNNGRQGSNVGQGEWLNLNTLWQGTIFEAVLTSELNTDLPGEITARIAKNIYSSQDGRYLLIPQNSVVYGTYNSSISYSQNRVQVAWHTLIRPDGYQIQLGNMNGTDAKGASGLKGWVNDHPLAYLKAIGLMSVFSIVNTEFSKQMNGTQNEYVQNLLANSQNVTMELGDKLIDRAMNVQPTIKIKSGTKINIVVNQNLNLPPCEDIPVTQAYHKQR